jgi:ElaB/YqjD/DUF883 family membrane-anchored ribosome-binding protein
MVSPVKDVRREVSSFPSSSSDEWTLEEMRERVASIADDLKKVVEARTEAAKEQAQDGVRALRKGIRRQPALAMGIATAAGAVLALIAVPRFGRRTPVSRWDAWMPSMPSMPAITRADLYDFAHTMQNSASRAVNSVPLTSSLERLVDAVSKVEPNASLTSAIEKASTWFQKMRAAAKS